MSLPAVGSTRHRFGLNLQVRCGNTDSDSGSATYQPDEGWAITNYTVSVNTDFGETSKSISYVQGI
jgi:hypothetical protein